MRNADDTHRDPQDSPGRSAAPEPVPLHLEQLARRQGTPAPPPRPPDLAALPLLRACGEAAARKPQEPGARFLALHGPEEANQAMGPPRGPRIPED